MKFIKIQRILGFWAQKCVPGRNGSKIPIKTTRNTWYFGIAPRARTFSQKSAKFAKITEIHKFLNFREISIIPRFPRKSRKSAARGPRPGPNSIRTDGGFRIWAALRSRAHGRSAPGPRESGPEPTGIRPRADGNPAPSRRKSGPEPTEIRPRADGNPAPTPIPSPPLKILTLLTSRSGRTLRVPPSLQQTAKVQQSRRR